MYKRQTLHTFGYRDSGYIGDPANQHPDAFINADERQAIGRVVELIRHIRPQVVITHDETGGYYHPDHIFCWKITSAGFAAAADATQYPEIGPAPYQPQRLYYTGFSNRMVKVLSLIHILIETWLAPGDVLVLYTDGIVEAFDRDYNEFGRARLEEIVGDLLRQHPQATTDEVRETIISSVRAFAGSATQVDDMTLLIIRRGDSL